MIYLFIFAVLLILALGPQLWVKYVLQRHNRVQEDNFPGNGAELARHLLDRYGLQEVSVEVTEQGDHYDPMARAVRLTRDKFEGSRVQYQRSLPDHGLRGVDAPADAAGRDRRQLQQGPAAAVERLPVEAAGTGRAFHSARRGLDLCRRLARIAAQFLALVALLRR